MRVEHSAGIPREGKVQNPGNFKFSPPPPGNNHRHNITSCPSSITSICRTSAAMIAAIAGVVARAFPPLQRRVIVPSFFRRCLLCWRRCSHDRAQQIIVERRAGSSRAASWCDGRRRLLEARPWGFRQVPFRWAGRHAWSEGRRGHGDLLQSPGRLRC